MAARPARSRDRSRRTEAPRGARAAVLIATILVIGVLYVARSVLIPLALAVLLSFVLSPLVGRFQRWGLRRAPAVLLAVGLGLAGSLAVGWLVTAQVEGLAAELPSYRQNVVSRIRGLRVALGGPFGEARKAIQEIHEEIVAPPATAPAAQNGSSQPTSIRATGQVAGHPHADASSRRTAMWPSRWMGIPLDWDTAEETAPQPVAVRIEPGGANVFEMLATVLGPFLGPLAHVGIATVLVIFMLLQRDELLNRVIRLVGRDHVHVTADALASAAGLVSRYLLAQAFINVLNGTAIAVGLTLIGVPRALLWGFLAAVLRYLPFVGTWIAAAVPVLLAVAVFDDWGRPLLVAGLFLVLDLISANVLEPWLYGNRTGVAPIAVLVSTLFWTWLWGGIGLFLSMPLTVCVVVIGRHVPQLRFLAVLFSDQHVRPRQARSRAGRDGRRWTRRIARSPPPVG